MKGRSLAAAAGFWACLATVPGIVAGAVTGAGATEPCGLCDEKIVTNSVLAQCFLDEYPFLAGKAEDAIVVDLSECEQERGIVPSLAMPGQQAPEPSVTFVVTPTQLDCLKTKLERDDIELDPSATIELGSCR
jgi:hypothetical protein